MLKDDKESLLTESMRQALRGDQEAYHRFLTELAGQLRPYVRRRIKINDVEDVLQEILLSIHKARHTYDGLRPITPWLAAIVRYRVNDYLRQQYAHADYTMIDLAEVEDILRGEDSAPAPNMELLMGLGKGLPEKQRRILQLMHVDGFTAGEAGEELGMKVSAVKVAAHRAYKKMRSNKDLA